MGKIRAVQMGDVEQEEKQRRKAAARREGKKAKKSKVEGVGLKGGERTAVVEGTDIKPEYKELIEKVEGAADDEKEKTDKKKKAKKVIVKTRSKKYLKASKLVEKNKIYDLKEAVELLKKTSITKFDATVELHVNVSDKSLDSKKDSAKDVKGNVSLPHGTGRKIKIAVADEALIAQIESGKIDFDVLIARPSLMPKLAKVARVLGPKGLMPNPKNGTVTDNPDKKIKELTAGQIQYKSEPNNPIIHLGVGKISFTDKQIVENVAAVLDAVGRGKIAKATVSATMGPGIKINVA